MKLDFFRLSYTAGLIAATLSVGSYSYRVINEPPYQYLSQEYAASNSTPCPGETFSYTPALRVTHAPTVVKSYLTIWSVTNSRTAVPDKEGTGNVYIWTEANLVIKSTLQYKVPDLKPGDYQLRRALSSDTRQVSSFNVPFTVPTDCKNKLHQ